MQIYNLVDSVSLNLLFLEIRSVFSMVEPAGEHMKGFPVTKIWYL